MIFTRPQKIDNPLQFPVGTKVKVTKEAKPETTTAKHYGQTGEYKRSGVDWTRFAVVEFADGEHTVELECLTAENQNHEQLQDKA